MRTRHNYAWETWPDGQVRCFECDGMRKMDNSDFTRGMLRDARAEAKRAGATIPTGLHAHRVTTGGNPWYEVRDRKGALVWEGSASDAYEARANAIGEMAQ
jgi:hypothetical protein